MIGDDEGCQSGQGGNAEHEGLTTAGAAVTFQEVGSS
jgi:hypothetical protein